MIGCSVESGQPIFYYIVQLFNPNLGLKNINLKRMKYIVFFITLTLSFGAFSQVPNAGFIANWRIIAGEPILFTDTSSNSPTYWEWHFDGGSPEFSFDQNPIVVYNTHGTYTVTLISGNAFGSDTIIATGFLHSYEKIYGDTLNYPLPSGDNLLTDSTGYICGSNERHFQALANRFVIDNLSVFYSIIEGLICRFAYASHDTSTITFCIWAPDGFDGSPGSILASTNISMDSINSNITDSIFTDVYLYSWTDYWNDSTVFYAGFLLPINDTIAIFSSQDSAVFPGTAWAADSSGIWRPLSDSIMGNVNISMAIFPVMGAYINSVQETPAPASLNVFPNPAHDEIYIQLPSNGEWIARLYNSNGSLVKEQSHMSYSKNRIDCSNIKSGTYFIEVLGSPSRHAIFIKE